MLSLALSLVALPLLSSAHMTPFMPSMYGVGENFAYSAGNPVDPIGPGWTTQDDWWFRGPSYRSLVPPAGVASSLPAGGSLTMEIACHVAWTSYGWATTEPGSELDACPGSNAGPYHAGDPNSVVIEDDLISGCALAIADVEDIEDVTMDNLVIFSVNQNCIKQKMTTFEIPAKMPKCTGDHCICSWHWLANRGTANYYQTGFRCRVDGSPIDALPIAPPSDPVFCKNDPSSCTTGAKRPIYAYNYPSNVPWIGNDDRAGYHADWSFPNNGAQNDIFLAAGQIVNSTAPSSSANKTANPWFGNPVGAGGAPDLALDVSTVTSSSAAFGQGPYHTVDGWTSGYTADGTGNSEQEWSSNGEKAGAWVNLVWSSPVTFNQIVLFDRPNLDDQVTSANITFSDGSYVTVGALANDGSATYLNLSSSVTTSSLRLTVLSVSDSTSNVGLSEIEAFSVPASGFSSTTAVQGAPQIISSSIAASSTVSSAAFSSTPIAQNATSTALSQNATSTSIVQSASASSVPVNSSTAAPVASSTSIQSSAVSSAQISSVASSVSSAVNSSIALPSASSVIASVSSKVASATSILSTSSSVISSSASSLPVVPSTGSNASTLHLIASTPSSAASSALPSSSSVVLSKTASSLASTTTQPQSSLARSASSSATSTTTTKSAAAPLATLVDLARQATATASSQTLWTGQYAKGAIDGIIGGYLLGGSYYTTQEWASSGQKAGAWLQLNWNSAQSFNQIVLWDRPNTADQVLAGNITFDDGSGVTFGQLPNDAKTGLTINLANTVSSKSIKIYISQVSSTTKNTGLAEVQVYSADASKFLSSLLPTKPVLPALVASTPAAVSSSVVSSATSLSKVSSTVTEPIWSKVVTGVVPNPKSAAATSTAVATTTTASTKAQTTSSTTKTSTSATSTRLVWTRVTNVARSILAKPVAVKRAEIDEASFSNNLTRHVRDFRLISE